MSEHDDTYIQKMSVFLGIAQGIGIPKQIYLRFAHILKDTKTSFLYDKRDDGFPVELEVTMALGELALTSAMLAKESGFTDLVKIYQRIAEDASILSEKYASEYEASMKKNLAG